MNWDRLEGEWKQQRGKAMQHWGKMMNDELAASAGKQEVFVGKLQEKYGIAKEEAKRQAVEFTKAIERLKKSNARLIGLHESLSEKKKSGKKQMSNTTPSGKRRRSKAKG